MKFFNWSFGASAEVGQSEIESIFPLGVPSADFIKSDILQTYTKILTDTMERTHGLNEKFDPLLWDNCVQSESSSAAGLITMLAKAMTDKTDLFIVYVPSVQIVRKATNEEEEVIRADYKKTGESSKGVFVSFKKYQRTDMLQIYSSFEYCVLASLNKTLNVSKAVQLKISDLRGGVALSDATVARDQAKSIATALRNGNDVLMDVKDQIETAKPDTEATEKAITFLDAKRAFILGMPLSYISGEQTGGIGTTGEADMRAVERGLKQYYVSIIRPVLDAIFGASTEFKSEDFRTMTTALEALKAFDLVSEDNMSREAKQEIVARLFNLDPEEEQQNIEQDAAQAQKDAANGDQVLAQKDAAKNSTTQDAGKARKAKLDS